MLELLVVCVGILLNCKQVLGFYRGFEVSEIVCVVS